MKLAQAVLQLLKDCKATKTEATAVLHEVVRLIRRLDDNLNERTD